MSMLYNLFGKKYMYYIYTIINKYIYKDPYKHFILKDYNTGVKYVVDIDNIFSHIFKMTSDSIYILSEYSINSVLTMFKNKITENIINLIKIKLSEVYIDIDNIINNIIIIPIFSNKIIIVFKTYYIFLSIFNDKDKFNNLIKNFKHYKFILTILIKDEDFYEELDLFIKDNNLKYNIQLIKSIIPLNYHNFDKYLNFKIKSF
ncbi:hypothetical protein BcabD6B2_59000 (apicoplast) [Babesia caballi]|uniref:Uncharacterized protein n=1 Tax=Babesia caballi TaxID=5871 RepID=A0AAV4M265_BABCB|nr:hypothetical protein BcabD6B2_59000 [Babesia caballi]